MSKQTRSSTRKRAGKRRTDVLPELEKIFLQEGFQGVTVDKLAARLKCSKRTLYELAPSKDELIILVMNRWLERIRHLGRVAALEHHDPQERVIAYLRPGVTESAIASRKFLADLQAFPPALAVLTDHQRQRSTMLEEIIDDGIKRGRFRNVHSHLVTEIFLAGVNRINDPDFLADSGVEFSEAFDEFYKLIFDGILVDRSA